MGDYVKLNLILFKSKKSRLFPGILRSFCQVQDHFHLTADALIALPAVGAQTVAAVLDAVIQVFEIAAAVFSKAVKRTVAKKTAEDSFLSNFIL